MKIRFVRKAIDTNAKASPAAYNSLPETGRSNIGSTKPQHKYIKREQVAPGKYAYKYDQSNSDKAPSSKDNEQMIQEFQTAMQQDFYWNKFAAQFDISEFNGIVNAMSQRGEMVDVSSFLMELERIKNAIGIKASEFVPTSLAAREIKEFVAQASSNPKAYNDKLIAAQSKQKDELEQKESTDISHLQGMGIDDDKLDELKQNPSKLKEMIDRMQNIYANFSKG